MSWFQRLKDGLQKTSEKISDQLKETFTARKIDDEVLESLEEILIQSDLGLKTSMDLVEKLRKTKLIFPDDKPAHEVVKAFLQEELVKQLEGAEEPLVFAPEEGQLLRVVLLVGVNGSGKTTTAGKLGAKAQAQGLKVGYGACDTFRMAAVEQLQEWAYRIDVPCYTLPQGSDPGAAAHRAVLQAAEDGLDVLFLDTAGRLQNKSHLMSELEKIYRVVGKALPGAPHEVLLVLDGTVGQNALSQVSAFQDVCEVTGLVVTKLDGTAKGGMILPLYTETNLPIKAIGVGEKIKDLDRFDAKAYTAGLLGIE